MSKDSLFSISCWRAQSISRDPRDCCRLSERKQSSGKQEFLLCHRIQLLASLDGLQHTERHSLLKLQSVTRKNWNIQILHRKSSKNTVLARWLLYDACLHKYFTNMQLDQWQALLWNSASVNKHIFPFLYLEEDQWFHAHSLRKINNLLIKHSWYMSSSLIYFQRCDKNFSFIWGNCPRIAFQRVNYKVNSFTGLQLMMFEWRKASQSIGHDKEYSEWT